MLVLCPLWYLPHFCHQRILYILDHHVNHRSGIAFAALLVMSRVVIMAMLLRQFNMWVSND